MQKQARDKKGRFIKQNTEDNVVADKVATPSKTENKEVKPTSYSFEYSYKKIGDKEPEFSGKYTVTENCKTIDKSLSKEEIQDKLQLISKSFDTMRLFSWDTTPLFKRSPFLLW